MTSFYRDKAYPVLVNLLGNPGPIRALRERVVPLARGTVLEIGFGAGANLPCYDPARVTRLLALEPNPGMLRLAARQRHRTSIAINFLTLPGERIPMGDESVDSVVSTFTLCTIPAVHQALLEAARVLKRNGLLIFLENTAAEAPEVRRWQRRWEPIHRRVFQGLLLTRDIPSLITGGGFRIEHLERGYLSRFPKSWSHCCWGTASRL